VTAIGGRGPLDADAIQYADGFAAGYRAAEAEITEAWAVLARRIRLRAERASGPIPEPRVREQPDAEIWFTAEELAERDGAA